MNTNASLAILAGACAVCSVQAADPELQRAETNRLNRFSFDARIAFNINAQFKNLGRLKAVPNTRTTPDGATYNYDDGYVLTDVSGNYGGETWNWGYDNDSQVSGNTILMSRSRATGSGTTSSFGGDEPQFGGELAYNRELGRCGDVRYGIEAALSYLNVSLSDDSSFRAGAEKTTDAYPYTPGTTPPGASYQGTFEGPGFVIGDTPSSSQKTKVRGVVTGRRDLDADVWGFRLGPYAELPLGECWSVSVSAGLAGALVNATATWDEKISVGGTAVATSRGSGSASDVIFGAYASGKIAYHINEHWSVEGGAQFQTLGKFDESLGGRRVALDFGSTIFALLGVSYTF